MISRSWLLNFVAGFICLVLVHFRDMRSVGVEIKDWKILRDVTWNNMVRATKAKVDKSKTTGAEGSKLMELDHQILDYLGKESANMVTVSVDDSDVSFATSKIQTEQVQVTSKATTIGIDEIEVSLPIVVNYSFVLSFLLPILFFQLPPLFHFALAPFACS